MPLQPQYIERPRSQAVLDAALAAGYSPLVARVVAGRIADPGNIEAILNPAIKNLDDPMALPDIDKAATRIAQAVMNGAVIGIAVDHDCDGVSSGAVLYQALLLFGHPKEKMGFFISHRLREGYGLTQAVVDRILKSEPPVTVLITADKGSSDEARIAILKAAGCDVIVSDHHELPVVKDADGGTHTQPPPSAFAVVSPAREDSIYPDPLIAGCMVAWLLMTQVNRKLMEAGRKQATLRPLLQYVTLGTISDCVSLGQSKNNRAVVLDGLRMMAASSLPAFQVVMERFGVGADNDRHLTAETLAFQVCPRIAAVGRLDAAAPGLKFLLAKTVKDAREALEQLTLANDGRKAIEKDLTTLAIQEAEQQVAQGKQGLVINLGKYGHAGVHGIVASRVVEAFGRPTVILSQKVGYPHLLAGSCRNIPVVLPPRTREKDFIGLGEHVVEDQPWLHLRQFLQEVADAHPGVLPIFGGHRMAAGLTIDEKDADLFSEAFNQVVVRHVGAVPLRPVVFYDGPLELGDIGFYMTDEFRRLEPWGRGFEGPSFMMDAPIQAVRPTKRPDTLTLEIGLGQEMFRGVWFRARNSEADPLPVNPEDTLRGIISVQEDWWKGDHQLKLVVNKMIEVKQMAMASVDAELVI